MKKCPTSLVIRRIQIKPTIHHYKLTRMAKIKNQQYQVLTRSWTNGTHTPLVGIQKVTPTSGNSLVASYKVKNTHILRPSNPTPRHFSSKVSSQTCNRLFIATLKKIATNGKQPKLPYTVK